MEDYSLFEKNHPTRQRFENRIMLGIISRVLVDKHICQVRPFNGQNDGVMDCQWLDVDEDGGYTPRAGNIGLVFSVDGQYFFWGVLRPMNLKGTASNSSDENVNATQGAKSLYAKGGSRVTVKPNGIIEIYSGEQLRSIYYPLDKKIYNKCRKWEFVCDGGTDFWGSVDDIGNTIRTLEYRRDPTRTMIVSEDIGYVDSTIIKRMRIGPAVPSKPGVLLPIVEVSYAVTGETNFAVHPGPGMPGGFSANIKPTGDVAIDVNTVAQATISALGDISLKNKVAEASMSAAGDINLKNAAAQVSATAAGEITIKAPGGEITISVAGEMSVKAIQKATIEANVGIDVTSKGPINVKSDGGPVTVSGATISIDGTGAGGAGATGQVLTFPTAISDFTGLPIQVGSQTVKCSP